MAPRAWRCSALLVALLGAAGRSAHKPSDSYLTLKVGRRRASAAAGTSRCATSTSRSASTPTATATSPGARCAPGTPTSPPTRWRGWRCAPTAQPARCDAGEQLIDEHTDGAYTVLPLRVAARARRALALDYTLFADLDPQHRGLLNLHGAGATRSAVLGPQAPPQRFELAAASRLARSSSTTCAKACGTSGSASTTSCSCCRCCCRRCWCGSGGGAGSAAPSVSRRRSGTCSRSSPRSRWRTRSRCRWRRWASSRCRRGWVESAIAASVVLAALNNVWPLFHGRRWVVAFVLRPDPRLRLRQRAGRPRACRSDALLLALVGFNLGVELGQLAIVARVPAAGLRLRRTCALPARR